MAQLEFDDLGQLMLDMKDMLELPKDVKEDILNAGARILARGQEVIAKQMGVYNMSPKYSGKHVADSVEIGKIYHDDNKMTSSIYVFPNGTRENGNGTIRQTEVAFLNEYGTSRQISRPFMRKANELYADDIVDAEFGILSNYYKSKGF